MEFYKQKGYTQQKDNNWAKIGCSNVVVSSSDWNEHQVYNLLHFVFCSFADISYTLLYCSYMLYTVIHCTFAGICYTLYFCRHLLYTVIHCTFAGICYTPLYTVLFQASVIHYHHWREGNLPANSKCLACKKTCWSSECLAGMRCEWCGLTVSWSPKASLLLDTVNSGLWKVKNFLSLLLVHPDSTFIWIVCIQPSYHLKLETLLSLTQSWFQPKKHQSCSSKQNLKAKQHGSIQRRFTVTNITIVGFSESYCYQPLNGVSSIQIIFCMETL